MTPDSLAAALERLYTLRTFGIKPGLDAIRGLLDRLGNPQHACAAIHVAGTNGKGSVSAMLASILQAAGHRVGLYTSPHLVRFNERIRINGEPIPDAGLGALFEDIEPHARALAAAPEGREVTFFEFTTALAFEYFRRQGVRLVVLETGMGGRLDATNVVTPLLSVITRISLEHMEYLGRTLEAIAAEKAGIIKPGRPVVYGAMPEEAAEVIRRTAQERGCDSTAAETLVSVRRTRENLDGQRVTVESTSGPVGAVKLPLLGRHQLENVALAVAAVESLRRAGVPVAAEAVCKGLETVRWPGRLQVLARDPVVLLDGAHNPGGADVLAAALRELLPRTPVALVWGMCADKDFRAFASALSRRIKVCWTVPIRSERSVDPQALAAVARGAGWETRAATLPEALRAARAWASEQGGAVCVCGSLFLAGEVLELENIAV